MDQGNFRVVGQILTVDGTTFLPMKKRGWDFIQIKKMEHFLCHIRISFMSSIVSQLQKSMTMLHMYTNQSMILTQRVSTLKSTLFTQANIVFKQITLHNDLLRLNNNKHTSTHIHGQTLGSWKKNPLKGYKVRWQIRERCSSLMI